MSADGDGDNHERIHRLANILHNLPGAVMNPEACDLSLLSRAITDYENRYGKSGVNLSQLVE